MSNNTPKIIMVGKGYKNSSKNIKDIIGSIAPSCIPGDLLDSVVVQLIDNSKYKIDKRYLSDGIDYSTLGQQLAKFGISQEVTQVEIVVDLEKADKDISSEVDQIFGSYF